MPPVAEEKHVIECADTRLGAIIDKVFSPEAKFPSLKFAMMASYCAFFGLCAIAAATDGSRLSMFIKSILSGWVISMLALLSPICFVATSPLAAVASLPFVLLILFYAGQTARNHLNQPRRLVLSPTHLAVMSGASKQQMVTKLALVWESIEAVEMRNTKSSDSDNWHIVIRATGKKELRIRNGNISNPEDRERLLQTLKTRAPQAVLDPELFHTLTPVLSSSYTEIWLRSLASPPKRARLAPLDSGNTIGAGGRYRINSILTTGGQAVVYTATDTGSDVRQEIIVKEIVLPIFGDENTRKRALDRFAQESQLLQKLDNERVVKLLDFFVEDHRAYFILEKIEGFSLSSLVQNEGPLSESRVLELARQMCEILSYLHGLQPPMVHRDFTPDNLILCNDGKLKLIDFNVALEANYTTTASVVGKRAYLPPEQFRGKPTPQSDIYAFGATLYFLLTGEEPEPITSSHPIIKREDISPEVDALVARATEPDCDLRFQSVGQIADLIHTIPCPAKSSAD